MHQLRTEYNRTPLGVAPMQLPASGVLKGPTKQLITKLRPKKEEKSKKNSELIIQELNRETRQANEPGLHRKRGDGYQQVQVQKYAR